MEQQPTRILMFYKLKCVVVTLNDERGRRIVYDCLPQWVLRDGWIPVGRLVRDSRGLLLFTQAGNIVELLTRPLYCSKPYEVWVRGRVMESHIAMLKVGIVSNGEVLKAKEVRLLGSVGPKPRVQVALDEGKNRHFRRLFAELKDPQHGTSFKVMDLKRIAIGSIKLDLPSGCWRFLFPDKIEALLNGNELIKTP